jgi:hypothetical protein
LAPGAAGFASPRGEASFIEMKFGLALRTSDNHKKSFQLSAVSVQQIPFLKELSADNPRFSDIIVNGLEK